MATTTTNYGFDIPQSTDLVKDGATAIATLGQDIDTAMNTALGTKKAGMVLLNTTSFSGVASQSINDVFSSTYDNYLINYKNLTNSTNSTITLKLRVSGTDTSTNYGSQRIYAQGTTLSANRDGVGTDEVYLTDTDTTAQTIASFQTIVFSPNKAEATTFQVSGGALLGQLYELFNYGFQNSTTQFTGFTLIASSGTFGGTVSVYGYNK